MFNLSTPLQPPQWLAPIRCLKKKCCLGCSVEIFLSPDPERRLWRSRKEIIYLYTVPSNNQQVRLVLEQKDLFKSYIYHFISFC